MTGPPVIRVLAPNPGPFTLEGTNTWVVGRSRCIVIDPGPDDPAHLRNVMNAAGTIEAILLTHHHPDHAPGAARLSVMTGSAVHAASPAPRELALSDGQVIEEPKFSVRVVSTPGHTEDHLAFFVPEGGGLFTGDAVLGRGTSVIDPPEGDLAAYLRSLDRLAALDPAVIYPGHGPVVEPALPKLREYAEHRRDRERQILGALAAGPASPEEIVPTIYGDYPPELLGAAARSVLAHLLKLEKQGVVRRGPDGRFAPVAHPADGGSTIA